MIFAGGYRSMVFANIDSADNLKMTITIDGHYTGYGANVICRPPATCQLNCGQTGCFKLNYICIAGAECNINPVGCAKQAVVNYGDGIVNGILCPEWKESEEIINDLILINDDVYIEEQSDFESWPEMMPKFDSNQHHRKSKKSSTDHHNGDLVLFLMVLLVTNFMTYWYLRYRYRDNAYIPISNPRIIHFQP